MIKAKKTAIGKERKSRGRTNTEFLCSCVWLAAPADVWLLLDIQHTEKTGFYMELAYLLSYTQGRVRKEFCLKMHLVLWDALFIFSLLDIKCPFGWLVCTWDVFSQCYPLGSTVIASLIWRCYSQGIFNSIFTLVTSYKGQCTSLLLDRLSDFLYFKRQLEQKQTLPDFKMAWMEKIAWTDCGSDLGRCSQSNMTWGFGKKYVWGEKGKTLGIVFDTGRIWWRVTAGGDREYWRKQICD